jgi:GNAT superfamily N-acetyltransferase
MALLRDGWREMEVLEVWVKHGKDSPATRWTTRFAVERDHDPLKRIAMESFEHDRLHRDETVPDLMADAWKAHGVDIAMADDDTLVLVCDVEGAPAGFITVKDNRVGLLAVDIAYRRMGVGVALLRGAIKACDWPLRAGTQTHNKPARALYEAMGFVIEDRQRTFHK